MDFSLSEQATDVRDAVREVLAGACPPATVRAAWPGADPAPVQLLWQALGNLGLMGALVPEELGGLGFDDEVAVAAMEQAGWAGVPGPLVETVCVAAPLLATAGALPAGLLEGAVRVAVRRGPLVPYAAGCDAVLTLSGEHAAWDLAPALDGPPVPSVDGSRLLGRVVSTGDRLRVSPADLERAQLRGTLGTAAFLLGLARRQLELTVAYVKDRTQFGVQVGSFQAVKHPLADATVGTEFAWPAVLRAAYALSVGDGAAGVQVSTAVSMAKALASDAAYAMSRVCLQAHGAMGYTTEYDLQLFAKRTWAMAADWGSAADHRDLIAAHLRLDERTSP